MRCINFPVWLIESVARRALGSLMSPQTLVVLGGPIFWLERRNSEKAEIDLCGMRRVLVVRLDEIGDVVMTTPFLRELRRNMPQAWITLIVNPDVHNLVELCPYVDEVLTYDWGAGGLLKLLRRHWRALKLARKHFWGRHFDLAILPRWDFDRYHAIHLMYLSGSRWRVGYSESVNGFKEQDNKGFDRFLTHSLQDNNLKHEVEHNLDVIRYLGGKVENDQLELWVGWEDEAFAEGVLRNHKINSRDLLVGFGPGAGAPKRQWPVDLYVRLGLWLENQYRVRLVIIGGPEEKPLGNELERKLGSSVLNAVGKTTLRQAAALLKRTSLYVGSDAGPMHIAAAVGVPVVELSCHPKSGSPHSANSPVRFGPLGKINRVVQPEVAAPDCSEECVADAPHCILGISLEEVKQEVAETMRVRGSVEQYARGGDGMRPPL